MQLNVTLPGLVATSVGSRHIAVEATTLAEAVEKLRVHPRLAPLVFDDTGAVRRHVLIFHNDTATKHLPSLDVPLRDGDTLAIVQAVSGG